MSRNIIKRRFTYDECLRMSETGILSPTERVELIDGELLVMSPIGPRHNAAVNRTTAAIIRSVGDKACVWNQSSVLLHQFAAPQPDIAMLRWKKDYYAAALPGLNDILLIVEVADASLEYDTTVKLALYAILGIPEYWVADLRKQRLLAHSNPNGDTYSTVRELRPGETIAPLLLPDCWIPVELLLP